MGQNWGNWGSLEGGVCGNGARNGREECAVALVLSQRPHVGHRMPSTTEVR